MESLPHDIALDILSRLPITTLITIKRVCRSWRALVQHPRLPSMHHVRANTRNPCLILHCHFPIPNELYFTSLGNGTSEVRRINARMIKSVLSEYCIVGSCNGVLCISKAPHFDSMFACNPFAGDLIELPKPCKYPNQTQVALGFGYHPTTEEFKLVRIISYTETQHRTRVLMCSYKSDVQVLTLGDDSWRSLGPTIPLSWTVEPGPSVLLFNGALHWLTKRYDRYPLRPCLRIISFDLGDEKFREIERPCCGSLDSCDYHLVVLKGCLSAVHCSYDNQIEIWMMQEYSVKESWSKDFVIGTAYLPTSLTGSSPQSSETWKMLRRATKAVCCFENGEILLEYQNRALVLYNLESKEFKDVVRSGQLNCFRTIAHVESLLGVQEILKCKYEPLEVDNILLL